MSRNIERLIWLAALLTLLGVMGFNYYKAHEHDEALALIAYPPTAYDTPIIPETAEEKETREAGLRVLKTGSKEVIGLMFDTHISSDEDSIGLPYWGRIRSVSYLLAKYLIERPEQAERNNQIVDANQASMLYLSKAMRQGYGPAHELYAKRAPLELESALSAFRAKNYSEGWKKLLPLAAEGYPPAIERAATITRYFAPLGDCMDSYWYIQSAKSGNPRAMERIATMLNSPGGMRYNPELAHVWEVKAAHAKGKKQGSSSLNLRESLVKKIEAYALDTPADQIPIGEPIQAPPVPLGLIGAPLFRLAGGGLLCFEEAVLGRPFGAPVYDPDKPFSKEYYQWWQDAISAPQE